MFEFLNSLTIWRSDFFFWPWVLLLLLLIPGFWWYLRSLKGQAHEAVKHPGLLLLKRLVGRRRQTRVWTSASLFLALFLTILALARPSFLVPEAHPKAGVMLAIDVSRSMYAQDILPNRFEAAKAAIKTFVDNVPDTMRVGLVSFAAYATQIVPLTDDHAYLQGAVDHLTTDFGTVIGDGLMQSLEGLPSLAERQNLGDEPERFATIILLSDGRNFGGVDPLAALEEVKKARVKVHTIGVGTLGDGLIPGIPLQYQFAARFDEKTMRQIAEETGGTFNFVDSSEELERVYKDLSQDVIWRFGRTEATAVFALAAALVLFLSLGLAQLSRQVY
ncbi:MAG: VWA domain-containing protein [Trueperaceae bacterium]|nr:VWA domain-containing protein [Trueperaceae bacterium]